jgi:outer membrane murein-binding lipoprotein Lpp
MRNIGVLLSVLLLASCMSKEEKMKEASEDGNEVIAVKAKFIEGAGDALQNEGKKAAKSATKGVGEIIKGVNSGISESISTAVVVSEPAFKDCFEDCKAEKIYGEDSQKTKKVTVYLIAKKDFSGKLILKALDENKKEIGRSNLEVSIKKDEAKYVDFIFDARTHLLQTESFIIK